MGRLTGGSVDLDEKLEKLKLENQILQEEMTAQQKKAIVKQIKKKYGRDWRKIINIRGMDENTLRQFANAGRKMSKV